ncbi:MAG: DNA repair protein RecO [Planctomycetota bacterium]
MPNSRPFHASRGAVTEALVARLNDYAESSAVAVLVTRNRGLVRAVAKGARRLKNSFRGPLDKCLLYKARLGRRGGDGLYHLNSAEVVEAYARLRRTPARFCAASLVVEVASDLMREDEPHPELFRLTVFSLKVLDRAPAERLPLAVAFFLARAVGLSGHGPEIDHCVACGERIATDERLILGPLRGGVMHPACAQGEPGGRSVRPEVLDLLRRLQNDSAARTLARNEASKDLRDVRRLLVDWLQHTLERRFRAALPAERELVHGGH